MRNSLLIIQDQVIANGKTSSWRVVIVELGIVEEQYMRNKKFIFG